MINGEQVLWRAVIVRALKDAKSKKLPRKNRIKARKWFCEKNADFEYVCFLANVDADALREKFLKIKK
jgi:hypothetical protein